VLSAGSVRSKNAKPREERCAAQGQTMPNTTQKLCASTARTRTTALLLVSILGAGRNFFVRGATNNRYRTGQNSRSKTKGTLKLDWRGGAGAVIAEETVRRNNTGGNKATDGIMASPTKIIRMVFSDVDGTLAHYPENLDNFNDDDFVKFPPSSTGMRGIISRETLTLCHKIRQTKVADPSISEKDATSVKFAVVSGMRTTTLLQRLPYLPLADAYCSENGGRIFFPVSMSSHELSMLSGNEKGKQPNEFYPPRENAGEGGSKQMYRLQEDMEWRQMMSRENAAGPDGYHSKSPALAKPVDSRRGVLWDFASDLLKRGWVLDYQGYATGFRVHMKKQVIPTLDAEFLKKEAPSSLSVTENLGSYDVYPSCCGKKNV
jgi:hypothetical protein